MNDDRKVCAQKLELYPCSSFISQIVNVTDIFDGENYSNEELTDDKPLTDYLYEKDVKSISVSTICLTISSDTKTNTGHWVLYLFCRPRPLSEQILRKLLCNCYGTIENKHVFILLFQVTVKDDEDIPGGSEFNVQVTFCSHPGKPPLHSATTWHRRLVPTFFGITD